MSSSPASTATRADCLPVWIVSTMMSRVAAHFDANVDPRTQWTGARDHSQALRLEAP